MAAPGAPDLYVEKAGPNDAPTIRLPSRRMRNLRDLGMRKGALAFDAENPSGAGSLYAVLGFRRHSRFATYRRTPADGSGSDHRALIAVRHERDAQIAALRGPRGGSANKRAQPS